MFKIKLDKNKWNKLVREQSKFYYDDDDKIRQETFDVKERGESVFITFSVNTLFKKQISSIKEMRIQLKNLLSAALKQDALQSINFSMKDFEQLEKDLKKMDTSKRVIKFDNDLNLVVDHPAFEDVSYNLKCWKNTHLTHPKYWERDIDYIRNREFKLTITQQQRLRLEELAIKEEKLFVTAYVFKSKRGYRLLLYTLREQMIKKLTEKCQIWYNKLTTKGTERVLLTFIEDEHEFQIEKEMPKKFVKIHALMKQGYNSYNCYMFTLPSILQFLKRNKIRVIGGQRLLPKFPKLGIKMTPVKLWKFQQEAFKAWNDNDKLGTIALPTGSGKTVIAMNCIRKVNRKRVLIVVPTIELVRQWKQFIIEWLNIPENKIGMYYAQKKQVRDITIITFQSGHRKISSEAEEVKTNNKLVQEIIKLSETSALIILDEGHHAPAPVFQKIMINVKCKYRLSLTATPYREDKNEALAFLAIGDVVYKKDYASLAKLKIVCPMNYNKITVPLTEDETDVIRMRAEINIRRRAKYSENHSRYSSYVSGKSDRTLEELYNDSQKLFEQLRFNTMKTELGLSVPERVKIMDVLMYADKKFDELLTICKKHKKGKILIFNERVAGAKVINNFLQENKFDSEVLTGSTRPKQRKSLFEQFKNARTSILVTTKVLDEGIDVPDANVVIIFCASKSKRQMIQRVGRGCRFRKGKIEYIYELVTRPEDYSDANDGRIVSKLVEKLKDGEIYSQTYIGRGSLSWGSKYRRDDIAPEERKLQLLEEVKSRYRDITGIINLKEQQKLIEKIKSKNKKGGKK